MNPATITQPPPLLLPDTPVRSRPAPAERSQDAIDRRLRQLLRLRAEREREALSLYEPVPGAVDFHESKAKTRIVIGSNRAGKTLCTAKEIIDRMLGVHRTYVTREGGISVYAVGRDQEHIGKALWPKFWHPGQFQIIRDERTGKWRPVRPDQEYDIEHKEKWRDAPPLLPERMVRDIAWEAKNKGIPRTCTLKNGSTITFYTGNGQPRRGFDIDGAWVDEELEEEEWIYELYRGLTDRNGWFIYSATPQSGSHWLFDKYNQAMSPFNDGKRIAAFKLLIKDNPFITTEAKQTILDGITDERQRRVRWDGEFALDERIVYPEFRRETHIVDPFWPGPDWNRYLVVDPGIHKAAVLFIAVAPDVGEDNQVHENAGEVHVYNELYLERCGADAVAARIGAEIDKDPHAHREGCFVAFIIDGRAGRQTQLGSQRTVESDYSKAFRDQKIASRLSGSNLLRGKDVIPVREEALHRLMQLTPGSAKPALQVHSRCKALIWEIPMQTRKKNRQGLVLEERDKRESHATECLEYFADYYPGQWFYFLPPTEKGGKVWREFMKRKKKRDDGGKVRLGPPV